uniref:Uncharacterized protein n=1 Tax=Pfiesteria piscicida TaxID=71001 RepID=E8Z6H1_PFIPI|nr:unknown [Pfiesteria piscicida]
MGVSCAGRQELFLLSLPFDLDGQQLMNPSEPECIVRNSYLLTVNRLWEGFLFIFGNQR